MRVTRPFWWILSGAVLILCGYIGVWVFGPRKDVPGSGVQAGCDVCLALFYIGLVVLLISVVLWMSQGFTKDPQPKFDSKHDSQLPNKSTAPNGGPATQLGNSGVTNGPPSVMR